jgi:regulator of sigma E protease
MQIALSPGHPVDVAVQRGKDVLDKTLTPRSEGPNEVGEAGLFPHRPVTVARLEPGMPAEKAGMKPGDVVVAVNGRQLHSIEALLNFLNSDAGKPIAVTVVRDGAQVVLHATPTQQTDPSGQKQYRLGFLSSEPVRVDRLPFNRALAHSITTNRKNSLLILELVEKMVQRKVSMKQIAGPIGIGAAAGEAARQPGWTPLLALSALISLNLGIFNLLPIPILDGGLILMLFVEGIMRRDISQQVKERVYQAAFVFLLLFGIIVIYNDLMRALPGLASRLP